MKEMLADLTRKDAALMGLVREAKTEKERARLMAKLEGLRIAIDDISRVVYHEDRLKSDGMEYRCVSPTVGISSITTSYEIVCGAVKLYTDAVIEYRAIHTDEWKPQ